ncbi:DUF1559 family PulG-like putative transporter [Gimesia panareensis]|uniref:BlaR1 peptidase M56 n=1 Tax=Gimesia panareensis TaxID=2527978 RepID=A0A517Q4C0_9PLAN|nr:DUF1559 domain-containing protein [Gimesia panareensis]QDT26486.1 BlaR1 peptidase M56 [Gimesia panareensis]QDU50637.1 BlaR1 peptidase M56 [Gimesia panareensis]
MHQLGISLLWLGLQVTIVTLVALVIYLGTKRFGPRTRSFLLSCAVGMTLLLALLTFSPWPRWQTTWKQAAPAIKTTSDNQSATAPAAPANASELPTLKRLPQESEWGTVWEGFLKGLQQEPVVDQPSNIPTPAGIVGWLLVGGFLLAALRLLFGYFSLKRLVSQATSLQGTAAEEALDVLAAEQQISHPLQLREHASLTTAAVIGWWRPVILLPTAWREWNPEQLRAVLAHELAHIQQRDYLAILGAELSRSLYFYHPLVHWLVARLRLEQELAADASAAVTSGGADPYLVVLAEMAVSQSNHRLTGPARAFLPTHSTFLRRIEMLKQKRSSKKMISRSQRVLVVCSMLIIGLLAAGFRGNQIGLAQEAAEPPAAKSVTSKPAGKSFNLDYVPNNALGVLALRPSTLLQQDSMNYVRFSIQQAQKKYPRLYPLGLPLQQIDSLTLIFLAIDLDRHGARSPQYGAVIQTTEDIDRESVIKAFSSGGKITVVSDEFEYFESRTFSRSCLSIVNDRQLIFAQSLTVLKQLLHAHKSQKPSRWSKQWQPVEHEMIATLLNLRQVRELVWKNHLNIGFDHNLWKPSLAPVWDNTDVITLGINLDRKISLRSTLYQELHGDQVRKTLDAAHVLGANMLEQWQEQYLLERQQEQIKKLPLIQLAEKLLQSIQFEQEGETVSLTASMSDLAVLADALVTFVPALLEARQVALRLDSFSNIRHLVLAMHLYHDKHGHFPPAVVMGPDGKTPHSWRVALLPYLDHEKLYKEYRLNEPWDSEHNKKVLAKMPAVFKHPNDSRPGYLTSYLGVVGPNTVFGKSTRPAGRAGIEMSTEAFVPGGPGGGSGVESKSVPVAGVSMRQITDGTSNTIAIVEARRDIPWTKPEDIPFDGKTLPKLGGFSPGGFSVGLCDGAARYLPDTIKPETLKYLLLINDSHPIDWP